MKLLSKSTKTAKGDSPTSDNYALYLDPSFNKSVCLGASAGCRKSCLVNSGLMLMPTHKIARYERTKLLFNEHTVFMGLLKSEIAKLQLKAEKQGKKLAVRLNGTSDLDWSDIYKSYPSIQFYEYTKRLDLLETVRDLPNVHMTFSRHEAHTEADILQAIKTHNVAVVFSSELPKTFFGIPVINGDENDKRFNDDAGVIVGLKLKGTNKAKDVAIKTGFSV